MVSLSIFNTDNPMLMAFQKRFEENIEQLQRMH